MEPNDSLSELSDCNPTKTDSVNTLTLFCPMLTMVARALGGWLFESVSAASAGAKPTPDAFAGITAPLCKLRKELDDMATGNSGKKPIHPQYVARLSDQLATEDSEAQANVARNQIADEVWIGKTLSR
jgi:hypothetical protein